MLPDSTQIKDNSNIPKFADTGIEELVKRIVAAGGNRSRLVAKIAGGAQMFAFQNKSSMVRVGERNVEATKAKLKQLNIPILAEDTGKISVEPLSFIRKQGISDQSSRKGNVYNMNTRNIPALVMLTAGLVAGIVMFRCIIVCIRCPG